VKRDPRPLEWNAEKVSSFWNFHVANHTSFFADQVGKQIVEFFGNRFDRDCKILDFGAGSGALTRHLLQRGNFVGAFDVNSVVVQRLDRELHDHPRFLGAFSEDALQKFEGTFNIIFLLEVIEHLSDEELSKLMKSCRALLCENGMLIITTPNNEDLSKSLVFCPECGHFFHRWQHQRAWSSISLRHSLTDFGFAPVDIGETFFARGGFFLRMAGGMKRKFLGQTPTWPNLYAVARKDPSVVGNVEKN